ncbi:MAG: glycosyltransferase family 4 protein [Gammaproteobacteria bacterium]|nr:glycosyltransferase family 4 protein [Gammaproteobacteria bacterium]
MKIAIIMRAMDQDSGFRANVEALIDNMVPLDPTVTYLLLYRTSKWLGRFAAYPNVREMLVHAPHKFLWDQIAVPYRAWKEAADVIFNPKFSIPLISHCPVAMGLQEPAWWTWPQHYEKLDVLYQKLMLPRYIHKAAHLFPMSNFILEENRRVFGLPLTNATLAYAAADNHFQRIGDASLLEAFQREYQLPARFILSVTRVDHPGLEGSTSFHAGKNPETTFRAFARIRDRVPHELVFAGRRVRDYLLHTEGPDVNFERVRFLDFVPYEEMPKLYNLAELFVNPAYYEGCPGTLLQAMACGCPMVVANSGGSADVGSGAALFADPYDPDGFADKMLAALTDDMLRQELRAKSLQRSGDFKWEKTASDMLNGLLRVAKM